MPACLSERGFFAATALAHAPRDLKAFSSLPAKATRVVTQVPSRSPRPDCRRRDRSRPRRGLSHPCDTEPRSRERANVALDIESVPIACMANVIDRDVVVLTPKEGHAVITVADAQHGAGSRPPLPFCHHPVLDADAFATVAIRPSSDIPRGVNINTPCVRLQIFTDHHAAVEPQACFLGKLRARGDNRGPIDA